jgi:putative colanic acid biosynthesis acetyltransferase WcaF
MKALKEIGIRKAIKFGILTLGMIFYKMMIYPQMRVIFLKILGAKIGKNVIIHNVKFFNYYRKGFKGLSIGDNSFLGNETMIDLADKVSIENYVTLAERVLILTHTNVGYKEHPLQKFFPSFSKPVIIERGSFIGANVTILPGCNIKECSFIAAGSVVTKDTASFSLYAGTPAKFIKSIE